MDNDYIETQLKKFNMTDSVINELKQKYTILTINGIDDTDGYKTVHESRMIVKNYRIDIEKRRKELTEDALKYQRAINSEAKRITSLLTEIECYLENEQKTIYHEKLRIKNEKEQKELMKIQIRIDLITRLGFRLNYGNNRYEWEYNDRFISHNEIKTMSENDFDFLLTKMEEEHDIGFQLKIKREEIEKEKKEQEEKKIHEEKQRMIQQSKELEIERKRLTDEKIENDRKLRIERENLTQQRLEIESEKRRIELLSKKEEQKSTTIEPIEVNEIEEIQTIKVDELPIQNNTINSNIRICEWIDVNNSLPKEDDIILATDNDRNILYAIFHDTKFKDLTEHDEMNCDLDGITHWMKLPEPPNKETE